MFGAHFSKTKFEELNRNLKKPNRTPTTPTSCHPTLFKLIIEKQKKIKLFINIRSVVCIYVVIDRFLLLFAFYLEFC